MCRNIRTLHNFEPPATDEEIRASALQFVRKLSGFTRPSKANEAAFSRAVEQVAQAAHELLDALVTNAPPRDREVEARRAPAPRIASALSRNPVGLQAQLLLAPRRFQWEMLWPRPEITDRIQAASVSSISLCASASVRPARAGTRKE